MTVPPWHGLQHPVGQHPTHYLNRGAGLGERLSSSKEDGLVGFRHRTQQLDKYCLFWTQAIGRARGWSPRQNEQNINADRSGQIEKPCSGFPSTTFIAGQRPFGHIDNGSELILGHVQPLAFGLQARTYFFKKMHKRSL